MTKRKRKGTKAKSYPRPSVPPVPADAFYFRPDQLAKRGQVGLMRVYGLIHAGIIPAVKVGRHLRVPRHQFEAMLSANPALFAMPPKAEVGR
jgi:excisionase family DNA binding protein